MNQEVIPEAPAFCKRLTEEEAQAQAKLSTQKSLVEMGMMFSQQQKNKKNDSYEAAMQSYDIGTFLTDYFSKDDDEKRKLMFELMIKISKLEKENKNYLTSITDLQSLNGDLEEDKENLDEMNNNLSDEVDECNEKLKKEQEDKKNLNKELKTAIDRIDFLHNEKKTTNCWLSVYKFLAFCMLGLNFFLLSEKYNISFSQINLDLYNYL